MHHITSDYKPDHIFAKSYKLFV